MQRNIIYQGNSRPRWIVYIKLKLNLGNHFDAATVNELVFAYIVKELGMAGRFKKLDFVVTNQPLYIGFSKAKGKSHKQLAEDYSRVLKQLREEGVIDNIIQKYTSF